MSDKYFNKIILTIGNSKNITKKEIIKIMNNKIYEIYISNITQNTNEKAE